MSAHKTKYVQKAAMGYRINCMLPIIVEQCPLSSFPPSQKAPFPWVRDGIKLPAGMNLVTIFV